MLWILLAACATYDCASQPWDVDEVVVHEVCHALDGRERGALDYSGLFTGEVYRGSYGVFAVDEEAAQACMRARGSARPACG